MYVDAYRHKTKTEDVIRVVERDDSGARVYRNFNVPAHFYYEDPNGEFESIQFQGITGTERRKLSKAVFGSVPQMRESLKEEGHIYPGPHETDTNIVQQVLAEKYPDKKTPKFHTAFFDIEADFHPEKGFAPAEDPFMRVTAITTYLDWEDSLVTFCMKPETMAKAEAEKICAGFDNTFLLDDEAEMLKLWLELIKDADIVSGWNSEGYDIPYLINRVKLLLGDEYTRNFCLWNQKPRNKTVRTKWGEFESYELVGRVHMDYLALFKKMTAHRETPSYKLDYIGKMITGESKIPYEGSLDELYNKDFKKYIDYSRQDVKLLVAIDAKEKYLELANTLAHDNTVCLPTTLKTVNQTDQAIINEAHLRQMRVPDRQHDYRSDSNLSNLGIIGGYVIPIRKGMHEWIGSIDINSLYPSVIRSLNISPETIVGQFTPAITEAEFKQFYDNWNETRKDKFKYSEMWHERFAVSEYSLIMDKDDDAELELVYNNGEKVYGTGAEFYEMIFNSGLPWSISANATVFRTDVQGIIPSLLSRWYSERQEMQAKQRKAEADGDASAEEFWKNRQQIKKINLNALYGALLNEGSRFFDPRMGQSVTLTGRCITRHMAAKMNEVLAGEYDHGKEDGALIYGDTDSIYFSAWPRIRDKVIAGEMEWDADTAVKTYDQVGELINDTWQDFMIQNFHTTPENGALIKGSREIVGRRGIMEGKKKYAIMVVDDEGTRKDIDGRPGKIKVVGLDIVRSDTPEIVRSFLEQLMDSVLTEFSEKKALDIVVGFKSEFARIEPWLKGYPKGLKAMDDYVDAYENPGPGKPTVPGHVRASLNWNTLRELHNDMRATPIRNGDKVVVCYLNRNDYGYDSIAYPVDEPVMPDWLKELPFDEEKMTRNIIDKKIDNILGSLNWDLNRDLASVAADSMFEDE